MWTHTRFSSHTHTHVHSSANATFSSISTTHVTLQISHRIVVTQWYHCISAPFIRPGDNAESIDSLVRRCRFLFLSWSVFCLFICLFICLISCRVLFSVYGIFFVALSLSCQIYDYYNMVINREIHMSYMVLCVVAVVVYCIFFVLLFLLSSSGVLFDCRSDAVQNSLSCTSNSYRAYIHCAAQRCDSIEFQTEI